MALLLKLDSCVYADDTLHLTGYIPQLAIDTVHSRTVKVTGCEIIPDRGFKGVKMTTVQLSGDLRVIGASAFAECRQVKDVNFDACTALTTIRNSAFLNCTQLQSIKLPPSLTTIEVSAFEGCSGLRTVDLSGCSKLKQTDWAFRGCRDITFTMPSSGHCAGKGGHGCESKHLNP